MNLLVPIPPTPAGEPLTVSVECRVQRAVSRGARHDVVIGPDWSVTTPHDLEAERIAAAFGGFTSCLALVDHIVPAVQKTLPLVLRRQRFPLTRSNSHLRTWKLPAVEFCRCSAKSFRTPDEAGRHLLSTHHLARECGVPEGQLSKVLESVLAAWCDAVEPPSSRSRAAALVQEPGGLRTLWQAGVSPEQVMTLAAAATGVTDPLPVGYYLGATYSGVDLSWLGETVACNPVPSIATWLAWTEISGDVDRGEYGRWLSVGLSKSQVEALITESVAFSTASSVAVRTGRTERAVGRDLAAWALAGCRPNTAQLILLERHGLGASYVPSRTAVDRLTSSASRFAFAPERTELGILLALKGTERNVLHVLEKGIRTGAELVISGTVSDTMAGQS